MKKIVGIILMLFFVFKALAQTMPQEIDELLKAYNYQGSFNGTALIAQKGEVLLEKGYGLRDVANNAFNDSNTVFQIGSLTKQFTATVILQLQEQGKLSVKDKIAKFFPDYPNGENISIENLLTNSSGIHDYIGVEFITKIGKKSISTDSLLALFKNMALDFKPGEKFEYSNSNYVLLGLIIEKATGKSYYQVVRENILKPIGMNHTGFDFVTNKNPNKAIGYWKWRKQTKQTAIVIDSSVTYAAGSMYSTIGDLYKWDRALYSNKILHDSSLKAAFTSYKNHYGYGWFIDTAYGKKAVMHEGELPGFNSFIGRILVDSVCIILLDNKQSNGLLKIAEDINAILNNQPYDFPTLRNEMEVDSGILKPYVGQYQLLPQLTLSIALEDGQLSMHAQGDGKVELFAERPDFFFVKMTDTQVEFVKNEFGKCYKLIYYDHGQKLDALKIK